LLLWMIYESGISHDRIIASFCDTQNEADCTYEHIARLNKEVFPIRTIQSEGFLALALRKTRFPSSGNARFCTQELKLKPTARFLNSLQLLYSNFEIVPVSGVRARESEGRKNLSEWGNPMDSYFGLKEWRPLIKWQVEDVLTIHAKYKIPLNDLYSKGAQRVGCFPCIMSTKAEIRMAAREYPETIDKLRKWEQQVGSTFFPPNLTPDRFKSRSVKNKKGKTVGIVSIDDAVKWAKTGHRAKGIAEEKAPEICISQHLACE